jgi:hypothetical protein
MKTFQDRALFFWIIQLAFAVVCPIFPASPSPPTLAVGRDADGRLELFYVNPDGILCRRSQSSPGGEWSMETRFDGPIKAVAVGQNADGRMSVFYVGADDILQLQEQTAPNGGWSGESKFADSVKVAIVGRNADGRLDVLFIGLNGVLFHRWQREPGGDWSGPESFAEFAAAAAMEQNADGRLEAFFIGKNDSLHHKWQTAPGGGWSNKAFFANHARSVFAGRNADGRIEAFFVGRDGVLRHKWQTAPNSGWSGEAAFADDAGGIACVGQNNDGRLEVFYTDSEGVLRHKWQTEASGGWAEPGPFGWTASDIAAARNADGRLEVFYPGADAILYHNWQLEPGLHWAGEYPFPSEVVSPFSVDGFDSIPHYAPARPDWHVNDHCFIKAGQGSWHFFGIVAPNPDARDPTIVNYFGHATAQRLNQRPWEETEPPFFESLEGGKVLWAPHVVPSQDTYYMFYCNGGEDTSYAIVLRTTKDLVRWSKPRVMFEDGFQARDPMVLRLPSENRWVMYYTATESPDGGRHVVAFRTSDDLLHWSDRGAAYTDFHEGTGYGPTESPFVVQRGDWFYLFIGPRPYDPPTEALPNWMHPGYAGTDVFRSKRWDRWTNADYVGHIRAHAPEIIQDENGDWFVSHAGIHQGGLFLTKFTWMDGQDSVFPERTNITRALTFRLHPNYPNPFNSNTRIRFDLQPASSIRIAIVDATGRFVRVLLDGRCPAGANEISWDGRDAEGTPAPSGIYLCRMEAGGDCRVIKMLLLR